MNSEFSLFLQKFISFRAVSTDPAFKPETDCTTGSGRQQRAGHGSHGDGFKLIEGVDLSERFFLE